MFGKPAPQKDNFLSDPDNLHYEIHCFQCREPLWVTKILKRSGSHVVSTETKKLGENPIAFSNRLKDCPLCGEVFYARGKKTGQQMYLLKDLNSGIKRLI